MNSKLIRVIQFRPCTTEAGIDVPEAFPVGKLSEGHTKELIQTGEGDAGSPGFAAAPD